MVLNIQLKYLSEIAGLVYIPYTNLRCVTCRPSPMHKTLICSGLHFVEHFGFSAFCTFSLGCYRIRYPEIILIYREHQRISA